MNKFWEGRPRRKDVIAALDLRGDTAVIDRPVVISDDMRIDRPSPEAAVMDRPPLKSGGALTPKPTDAREQAWLEEYAMLAKQVGIKPPNLQIEEFKRLLNAHDIPVFALTEVVAYMDKKAAAESKDKSGWLWRPLRAKDNKFEMGFGTGAWNRRGAINPASDYYSGPHEVRGIISQSHNGFTLMQDEDGNTHMLARGGKPPLTSGGEIYDRTIPLHALRKVAIIDKHYKGDVALFVSDYAPAPEIQYPDPFLLAVIPNPEVGKGIGRFVIDFWDEPGFGIDKMLKA